MTVADFHELCRYWERHPPLHILMAAHLGMGRKRARGTPEDLGGLLAMFGPTGGRIAG